MAIVIQSDEAVQYLEKQSKAFERCAAKILKVFGEQFHGSCYSAHFFSGRGDIIIRIIDNRDGGA